MAKLYIVPTPIGNLEDITLRAIRVLKEVDFILAEDTRTSGHLLKHFDIQNRLQPYHKFNEHKAIENIVAKIKNSKSVALISDAGTPAISDPGFLLTKHCVENDIEIHSDVPNFTRDKCVINYICDKDVIKPYLPFIKIAEELR